MDARCAADSLTAAAGGVHWANTFSPLGYRVWLVFWHELLNDLIDSEARGLLTGGNSLKLSSHSWTTRLRGILHRNMLNEPIIILEAFLTALERIGAKVEDP